MSPLVLALVASLGQEGYPVRQEHPRLSSDVGKAVVTQYR